MLESSLTATSRPPSPLPTVLAEQAVRGLVTHCYRLVDDVLLEMKSMIPNPTCLVVVSSAQLRPGYRSWVISTLYSLSIFISAPAQQVMVVLMLGSEDATSLSTPSSRGVRMQDMTMASMYQ
jgi:hypothetical protein